MRSFSTFKTPSIPANGVIQQAVTGDSFVVVDCTAPFRVSFNGSEPILMKRGRRVSLPEEEQFTSLTFFNDTAAALTVEYYAGTMQVRDDSQVFIKIQPTQLVANGGSNGTAYLDGDGLLSLPGTTYLTLSGTSGGFHRKQVIITNLDGALTLRLRKTSGSGRSMATIFPSTAWTLETDANLALHNWNGSAVLCQVMEIFYTDEYDSAGD